MYDVKMIEEEITVMLLSGAKLVITDKTLFSACNSERGKAVLYICLKSEKVMKFKVYFLVPIQIHQHERQYRTLAAFCCRPLLFQWAKYGRYMIFTQV